MTITVPGLSYQNKSNGDINGTKVELQVEYQANGSQWIDAGKIVIDGKTTSSYNREHSFRLAGESPWSVRVTRLTEDSESQTLQNKTIFSKLTTVFEEKLTYPGVAYVGVQIDAEQFSSIPARGYHCRGIKLKVPSNYDPITRLYTGDVGTAPLLLNTQTIPFGFILIYSLTKNTEPVSILKKTCSINGRCIRLRSIAINWCLTVSGDMSQDLLVTLIFRHDKKPASYCVT